MEAQHLCLSLHGWGLGGRQRLQTAPCIGRTKTHATEFSSKNNAFCQKSRPRLWIKLSDFWANHWNYPWWDHSGDKMSWFSWKEGKKKETFWCEYFFFMLVWIISLSSGITALLTSISSHWKCLCICIEVEKSKEANSFFLTCSLQLPSCPLPPCNTHSRHKDTPFPSDCEHGSLSLNVSGKWLILSHLPKSYWNAAVVGQLFKTPEIHRPRWHFPVFGTTIAIALDMFYTCVCISYFLQRTFYDERKNSLCLLSHKFCPSLYPPLDERGKKIKPRETPMVSKKN